MKRPKIEMHHVHAMRALRRQAGELSRNKNLSAKHRRQCAAEHKTYAQIESALEYLVERPASTEGSDNG